MLIQNVIICRGHSRTVEKLIHKWTHYWSTKGLIPAVQMELVSDVWFVIFKYLLQDKGYVDINVKVNRLLRLGQSNQSLYKLTQLDSVWKDLFNKTYRCSAFVCPDNQYLAHIKWHAHDDEIFYNIVGYEMIKLGHVNSLDEYHSQIRDGLVQGTIKAGRSLNFEIIWSQLTQLNSQIQLKNDLKKLIDVLPYKIMYYELFTPLKNWTYYHNTRVVVYNDQLKLITYHPYFQPTHD